MKVLVIIRDGEVMTNALCMKKEIFSKQYYDFVDRFVQSDFEDKKILGKFYTNEFVVKNLVQDILDINQTKKEEISIIDPFAGDGRMIIRFLEELSKRQSPIKKVSVEIWDIDKKAVSLALREIEEISKRLPYIVEVQEKVTDAFIEYVDGIGKYDICITNPPWGLLKPLKIFNTRCDESELDEYKSAISIYDEYMKEEFVISRPTRKFGKWGSNLGRIGTEVALKLIKKDGICGVVSPVSLFNDQVSFPLRKWIFENYTIKKIDYYPSELKLYDSADVSSITVVVTRGETVKPFEIACFCGEKNNEICLSKKDLDFIRKNEYSIPLETGFNTIHVLEKLQHFISTEEFCNHNSMVFTRELDETRISEKVKTEGKILFAKGYMVNRYSYTSDDLYIDEKKVSIPKTVSDWKLVWRDVSRNSQKRRMKCTLLPPNHMAGNSLGVIALEDENKMPEFKYLLAIMNSMVYEFQARRMLVSNHVSSGVVKKIRVPNGNVELIAQMVDQVIAGHQSEFELEVLAAISYGLSQDDFMELISTYQFEKSEKDELINIIKKYYGE